MKHPLGEVAIAYVAGIVLADTWPLPLTPLLVCGLALAMGAVTWEGGRRCLLTCAVLVTGMANFTFRTAIVSPHDLRLLASKSPLLVEVRGVLHETPSERVYQDGPAQKTRTVADVKILALRFEGGEWRPACGTIATATPGLLPQEFTRGSRVTISGILGPPPRPVAKGLFDYSDFLKKRGIYFQLRSSSAVDWSLEEAAPPSWSERFIEWAKATMGHGLPHEDEPLRLLWAMTLGWRAGLGGEVSEPFMRSGTMHVFAISGLHIALIALILVAVTRLFAIPGRHCAWVVIPLLWFYTGATGWQASAIRATLMSTIVLAGWALRRPSDLLNELAAAALIILVWDPQQLFQAGFLLSFAVVLSMALFAPLLGPLLGIRWFQPDPFLPESLQPWWARLRHWAWRKSYPMILTSATAWIGSLPLIAHYFHLFTPVTLLANLVIVPLSSLALISSLASLASGAFCPPLAAIFNHSAWALMVAMVSLSEWFAELPGAYFYVQAPGAITLALYTGALLALVLGWWKKRALRYVLIVAGVALGSLWLIANARVDRRTELTVLPLGSSHAIYWRGVHGTWLIDCGTDTSARVATRPFLAAKGLDTIDHLVLTHGDIRHVEGVHLLASSFSLRTAAVGSTAFRSGPYREAVALLERTVQSRRFVAAGDTLGPWQVMHPAAEDRSPQADDRSLVLLGEFYGVRVLLLSDLGAIGQERLLDGATALRANIVVTGFPLRGEPLLEPLVDAIAPSLIILAETPQPMSERRLQKVLNRLARPGVRVLHVRDTGAVTLRFGGGRWDLTCTWSERTSAPSAPAIPGQGESSADP